MKILPSMKAKEIIGIELGETQVKILHLHVAPYRTEVVSLESLPLIGKKDEQVAREIRSVLEKWRLPNAIVINLISARQVITKNIEIPSEDPDEIREIINLQAGRHTPYSREEIIADYLNLGTFKHSYSKILLIIVSRGVIKRTAEILNRAGVQIHKVVFAPEGMALAGQKLLKIDMRGNIPFVVLDIDENTTDFLVIARNKALFSRAIPLGCQEISADKEKYAARFIEEIKKSLEAYQNEDIEKKPTTLALVGAAQAQSVLKKPIEDNIPLAVLSPAYQKNIAVSPQAEKAFDAYGSTTFFSLIATACSYDDLQVDLTPDEIKMRKAVEERGKQLMKAGILVLMLFIVFSSLFLSKIFFKGLYLARLNQRYEYLISQVKELQGDFENIILIRNYLSHRGHSVRILAALHDVSPLDLKLTDIRYEEDGRLRVRGTADSMSTVFSFSENMEKSIFFHDVKTRNSLKRKEEGKEVTDFEIEASMEGESAS